MSWKRQSPRRVTARGRNRPPGSPGRAGTGGPGRRSPPRTRSTRGGARRVRAVNTTRGTATHSRNRAPRNDRRAAAGEGDAAGWLGWLRAHLDPVWRPGEWDGNARLFTGDLHSDRIRNPRPSPMRNPCVQQKDHQEPLPWPAAAGQHRRCSLRGKRFREGCFGPRLELDFNLLAEVPWCSSW